MFFLITSREGNRIGITCTQNIHESQRKGESGTGLACYRDQPYVKPDHFKDF